MLTPEERIILTLIYIMGPSSVTMLRQLLSRFHFDERLDRFPQEAYELLKELTQRGWLEPSDRSARVRCTPKVDIAFLKETMASPLGPEMLKKWEEIMPWQWNIANSIDGSITQVAVRICALGLLNHDSGIYARWHKYTSDYVQKHGNWWLGESKFSIHDLMDASMQELCRLGFQSQELDSYSESIRKSYLAICQWLSILEASPMVAWRKIAKLSDLTPEERWTFMTLALLEGDEAELRRLAQEDSKGTQELLTAYLAILQGQWNQADNAFQHFLKLSRLPDTQQTCLIWLVMTLAIIAACYAEAPYSRLTRWMRAFPRNSFLQNLIFLREARETHHPPSKLKELAYNAHQEPPLSNFIQVLILSNIADAKVEKSALDRYLWVMEAYLGTGLNLLGSMMLHALVQWLPLNHPQRPQLVTRLGQLPLKPFGEVKERKHSWEVMLDGLAALTVEESSQKPAKTGKRVGWLLRKGESIGQGLSILEGFLPCYQNVSKDGEYAAWQRGSILPFRQGRYDGALTRGEEELKPLVMNLHYYHDVPAKYLPHILLSDHIFLNDFSQPVKLVEEQNALISHTTARGETQLRLKYFIPDRRECILLDCSERGVVRFCKVSAENPIYAFFLKNHAQGNLVIPADGRQKLAKIAEGLAKKIPIMGSLSQEVYHDLPLVESESPEMHLLITQEGSGYRLEFRCKPLAKADFLAIPGKGLAEQVIIVEEQRVLLKRNLNKERRLFQEMWAKCPSLATEPMTECELEELGVFLVLLAELKKAGFVLNWHKTKPVNVVPSVGSQALNLSCRKMEEWFQLDGTLKISEECIVSLQKLLDGLELRLGNFIQLDDHSYLQLTQELLRKLEALKIAGQSEKQRLKILPAALPMLTTVLDGLAPKPLQMQLERIKAAFASDIAIPPHFQGTLRPYQEDGYRYLARLADCRIGCCLADDMGLGKTIELLALLLREAKHGPALVVSPASLCHNWQREALRFAPSLNVQLLPTTRRQEFLQGIGAGDLVICSYGIMQNEESSLESVRWHIVILDEAQAIKNYVAKRSQSSKRLQADIRITSTGTPIENNLLELWSLFDFLNPGLLGSRREYEARFTRNGMPLPALKRLVAPLIMRRKKSDVLDDLPSKTENTIPVLLSEEERAYYEILRRQAMAKLTDQPASRIAILAELTRLRRFCCHPSLVASANTLPLEGAKLQRLMELAQELHEAGNRTLVFSQYVDFLQLVRREFDRAGFTYQYLDGSTPPAARMKAVDEFQSGNGVFFLISLKAGGTGLNLTAASYVILADPWWNPAVEQQAADRVHRIGQQQPVTIYRMLTSGTIEEKVAELHARKRLSSEELLGESESTGITLEELMALLNA